MKTVFFGSSRQVIPILDSLRLNSELKLIITTEQGSQEPVPFYAKMYNINCISVLKSAELVDNMEIMQQEADLGVVADFGVIIPEQTFKHFTFGMVNIHPSLLPKYRGATPIQTAILNGETKTGVTIIQLDKRVDHGPILAQEEDEIKPEDNSKVLYEKLFKKGGILLAKILVNIQNQNVKKLTQNEEEATYTKTLKRDDGFMELDKIGSEKELFNRMVRAYFPWPGTWTLAKLHNFEEGKKIKFLPGAKVQVEGGREMDYKDFINGYPNADPKLLSILKND